MRVEQQPEIKKSEPFIAPQPMGKIAFLGMLATVGSFLFWWFWHRTLDRGPDFSSVIHGAVSVLVPVAFFCLMVCLMSVVVVMVRRFLMAAVISVVVSLPIIVFFQLNIWSIVACGLSVVSWTYWFRQVRPEADNQLKFSAGRITKIRLSSTITLLLLVVSIAYLADVIGQPGGTITFANTLIDNSAKIVNNILHTYYKDKYDPHMPLDTFLYNIGVSSAGNSITIKTGQSALDQAIATGLTQAQQAAVEQARIEFLKTFGIAATGDEEMQSVVHKIVQRNADHYLGKFYKYIPGLVALSIFFLLNIFNIVYRELIAAVSYIIFRILIMIGFLQIKKVQVEAEKISL